jgi:hypothetical protein
MLEPNFTQNPGLPQRTPTGSAPYFAWPTPQPPSVRSVALPPVTAPAPTPRTAYKAAVPPAYTPAGYALAHQVRNGSGLKTVG